jgi:hypothetical protein
MTYSLETATNLGPTLEHGQRHHRARSHPPLPRDKGYQEDGKDGEQGVDGGVAPRLRIATFLKRKQQTGRHSNAKNGANPIQINEFPPARTREVRVEGSRLCLEEEPDEGDGDRTDRQVD